MSLQTKIVVLVLAAGLSFLEFNLIVCSGSYCETLRASRAGSFTILADTSLGQADVVVTASLRP